MIPWWWLIPSVMIGAVIGVMLVALTIANKE